MWDRGGGAGWRPHHAVIALQFGDVPRLTERRFQVRAETKPEIWERLGHVLAKRHVQWALTGADAAERRTNYFHAEDTEIYAPLGAFDDRELLKRLVAQPAARGGNLLVIEPPAPAAAPHRTGKQPPAAPALLAYAELRYRGTEQALEAAEILLPAAIGETGAILSREGRREP